MKTKKKADGIESGLVQASKTRHAETNDDGDDDSHGDLGAEAGGVVRGLSRSILRSPIGRLPRRRMPIRQVARVSDRLSTSMDWYASAAESSTNDNDISTNVSSKKNESTRKDRTRRRLVGRITSMTKYWTQTGWPRLKNFTINVTKNTVLGLAVFETYGYVVSTMAPTEVDHDDDTIVIDRTLVVDTDVDDGINDDDDEDETSVVVIEDEIDEYARASLPIHFGAGFLAGSVHGIASGLVDGPTLGAATTSSPSAVTVRAMASYTMYHAMSHSCLFGAYEGTKRSLLHQLYKFDHSTEYYGPGYLTVFGVAGGLAGSIQHVVSHYGEHCLSTMSVKTSVGNATQDTNVRLKSRPLTSHGVSSIFYTLKSTPVPAVRPALWAFPPAAIGFIAFEYGKKFAT